MLREEGADTNPRETLPSDGRDETPNERSDRNWAEIIQELRATQTGTQIISGFLLTLPFQQRFTDLVSPQLGLYVALVILAAATTALGLAPVALHRTLFGQHKKERMVRIGNLLLRADLAMVSVLTGGVVLLIISVAIGWTAAWLSATAIALSLMLLLVVIPVTAKR